MTTEEILQAGLGLLGKNGEHWVVSSKAAEAPGGPDDARILMRELREEMLKMGWAVSTRPILRDLFQRLTEQLGTFPAPAAPSERADEPQLGKCTQSTFGHSGLHRKSWACGNGFVPVCPTCGSHLSSQEGK